MNSVDMANHLIFRAKNLTEYVVTTDVPDGLKFNGTIPFDISIKDSTMYAKVWAVDFNEAVDRLNEYLETCK